MDTAPQRHPSKPFSIRSALRVLGIAGALLLVPLASMLLGGPFDWDAFDFAVAAVLLVGTGLAFELAMATLRTRRARRVAGALIALALLATWAQLAVGIFH